LVEKNKFYGKEDECPGKHIVGVHDISNVFGKEEVKTLLLFKVISFLFGRRS
jgi:hypothetical protein